jgi:rhodanese-related sulfurtransferase
MDNKMKWSPILGALALALIIFLIPASQIFADDKPVWRQRAEVRAHIQGYTLISVDELKALYNSRNPFLIVDVRPDYEYSAGHIPDAVQIEFGPGDKSHLKPGKIHRFEQLLGPNKYRLIIIYCRDYS